MSGFRIVNFGLMFFRSGSSRECGRHKKIAAKPTRSTLRYYKTHGSTDGLNCRTSSEGVHFVATRGVLAIGIYYSS